MTRYRVSSPFASRQQEFSERAAAEEYAQFLLRLDPRLASVKLIEISETTILVGRKAVAA